MRVPRIIGVLALMVAGWQSPAVAQETGSISGTVTVERDAAPLQGVDVYLYRYDAAWNYWSSYWVARTDALGQYTASDVMPGSYLVNFRDPSGEYAPEFYSNALTLETGRSVSVAENEDVTGINVALVEGATISGQVTAQSNGDALEGVNVTVYRLSNGHWQQQPNSAYTATSGGYTLKGLPEGTYRVGFRDPSGDYATEFYNNALTVEAGQSVNVAEGTDVTGIDVALVEGATISGRVTVQESGDAFEGVIVSVYRFINGWWQLQWWIQPVTTDALGEYTLAGLPVGTYRVGFSDPSGEYAPKFHSNALTVEAGQSLSVTEGADVTGIDVAMVESATISGQVTVQSSGDALEGAIVSVYSFINGFWQRPSSTATDALGNYTLAGLPAGIYRIGFRGPAEKYAPKFHNNAVSVEAGQSVNVAEGADLRGIDAALVGSATISGRVTAQSSGDALEGVIVSVYRFTNGFWQTLSDWNYTTSSGNYTVKGLPSGIYRVGFRDPSGEHVPEFYGNALTVETGESVSVAEEADLTEIDAALADGATISGRVTEQTWGAGLQGVQIEVHRYEESEGYWINAWNGYTVATDAEGNYAARGLPAGTYRIGFRDSSGEYAPQFYVDGLTVETGTDVVVVEGSDVTGIDVALADGATISGKVTAQTGGAGLEGIQIEVYRYEVSGGYWAYFVTGNMIATVTEGNYKVGGVPPGIYRLAFRDPSGNYALEYYNNALTLETGQTVVVTAGEDVLDIDLSLADAGTISGKVTAQTTGASLAGIEIEAYRYEVNQGHWEYFWTGNMVMTDNLGNYRLEGLPAGNYRLKFRDSSGEYAQEFYDNALTVETAQSILVAERADIPNVNVSLAHAAIISGTVTSRSGVALEGIELAVYRFHPSDASWDWFDYGATDASGSYTIKGLPAGTYRLGFIDYRNGDYAKAFYSDAWTLGAAESITVAAGDRVMDIDIALDEGASISGTVVAKDGGDALEEIEVYVYQYNPESGDWDYYGPIETTDASGNYRVGGLAPGTYRLIFWDPNGLYATEFYNNSWTHDSAEEVVVEIGSEVMDVDAALSPGGIISGIVTAEESGAPLAGIEVECYRLNGQSPEWLESFWTDAAGAFRFDGLPPGNYLIKFLDRSGLRLSEYHGNAPNQSAAVPLILSVGENSAPIQASLILAGYQAWLAGHGIEAFSNNEPVDDYDFDGLSNGEEYAFGTNPAQADSGQLMEVTAAGSNVTLEFIKLNERASYSLQESSNLQSGTWLNSQAEMSESPDQSGVAIGYTRMRCTVPATGRKFFRIQATY